VQAAVRAFESSEWKDNRRLRSKILHQLAVPFEARYEDLIRILSLENGKVPNEAAYEVDMVPGKFRYWAFFVLSEYGRALEVQPGRLSFFTRSAWRASSLRWTRPWCLPCARWPRPWLRASRLPGTTEPPGVHLRGISFPDLARALGAVGVEVTRSSDIRQAPQTALQREGPTLIDIQIDPNASGLY